MHLKLDRYMETVSPVLWLVLWLVAHPDRLESLQARNPVHAANFFFAEARVLLGGLTCETKLRPPREEDGSSGAKILSVLPRSCLRFAQNEEISPFQSSRSVLESFCLDLCPLPATFSPATASGRFVRCGAVPESTPYSLVDQSVGSHSASGDISPLTPIFTSTCKF